MDPKVHVVVYATHSDGMYEALQSDAKKYGIDLEVISFGTKWISFFEKLRAVHKHISTVAADDLVVVIDAFDTRIRGTKDDIVAQWKALGSPDVVFSKDPSLFPAYVLRKVFGGPLNAGMYMGRAGALAAIQEKAMPFEAKCRHDDQCAFNAVAKTDVIAMDTDRRLFYNLGYSERRKHLNTITSKAVFYGFPGTISFVRVFRATTEYLPFFVPEIITVVSALVFIALYMWPQSEPTSRREPRRNPRREPRRDK